MEIINYDNKVNEIKMENIIYHKAEREDHLLIDWGILHECNYKCSYCFGQSPLNKNFIPVEKLKHAVDQIFKINKKYYTFNMLGGEITYYPYLLDLIKYIYSFENKNIYISIITNGSRKVEYFEELIKNINGNSLCAISIHIEYANIEHIKDLIVLFNNNNLTLNLHLMLHPEYKEKCTYFFNELISFKKTYNFDFEIIEILEPPTFTKIDSRYDKDFFNWIDKARNIINNVEKDHTKHYEMLNLSKNYYTINKSNKIENININYHIAARNNLNDFRGFYCCGGINTINIISNGEYSGATCKQYKHIGNIYEEDIDLYTLSNFQKCNIEHCSCAANSTIFKCREIKDAENYVSNYRKDNSDLIMSLFFKKFDKLYYKVNKIVDMLAWFIPVKKWRKNFRNKFN